MQCTALSNYNFDLSKTLSSFLLRGFYLLEWSQTEKNKFSSLS